MEQGQQTLSRLLGALNVRVPNAVVRHLLDTPVGNSLRGISDALDSLGVQNDVYQLPKEYLDQIEYPYLLVLPQNSNPFVVIRNDAEREKSRKHWEGTLLVAQKTEHTAEYRYVSLRNGIDSVIRHQLIVVLSSILLFFVLLQDAGFVLNIHLGLVVFGILLSIELMKREHLKSNPGWKYCKIGHFIDCEQVLDSKGSRFFYFARLSDLSFLFFVSLMSMTLIAPATSQLYMLIMLAFGFLFTIYSVVYQLVILKRICLLCMAVNLIVWTDAFLLAVVQKSCQLTNPVSLIVAILVSYSIWNVTTKMLCFGEKVSELKRRLNVLYQKDVFEWLLSRGRLVKGLSWEGIILVVHPQCRKCQWVYSLVPELKKLAHVEIISLADASTSAREFCKRNHINATPTVIVDNHILPECYDVEDLRYIL